MKTLKFLSLTFAAIFALIYLIFVSYVYVNQSDMVFLSSKLTQDYKFQYKQEFEEIIIPTFDEKKIHGLLFKAENSKGLVFYLHGNAGNLESWGNISTIYTSLGYDIFMLDYRGFGKSDGKIENELQVNNDVSAAFRQMKLRYPENKIVIAGYSIGSGPAAILAANNNPKALILQAPYYSFSELASSRVPYFPEFLKKFKFETFLFLPKVKAPIYIFHGNQDQLIPSENSLRLQKLLKKNDKLLILNNQDHVGVNENQDFQNELKNILN